MQMLKSVVDMRRFDIWRYHDFYPGHKVPEQFWLSDGRDTFTALEQIDETLWIKHEDQHPIGSHKGRSLAYQLSYYQSLGEHKFAISSSGNAAIAFLALTPSKNSVAFVSPHTDSAKLAYLLAHQGNGQAIISSVAPTLVTALERKFGYRNLRPSKSEEAIIGLSSIGYELWEQMPDISAEYAIMGVTTSGGNMLGLYQAFRTLQDLGYITSLPRLFPVLLQDYHGGFLSAERRASLEQAAQVSGGAICELAPVYEQHWATSFEGNTAYQAYLKQKDTLGKTILLFTGRVWPNKTITSPSVVNSLAQLPQNLLF